MKFSSDNHIRRFQEGLIKMLCWFVFLGALTLLLWLLVENTTK